MIKVVQGDITTLAVDAIVNAAESGCKAAVLALKRLKKES